ncbi:MAG: type II toxin-antitoxin system VapC family toxin [Propionibacteriaceae bacterium]|nr:type II toxin-antitoxin system VapC family toxin [Propionibacteriaceae bacterium]
MRALLDTNVLLWWLGSSRRLRPGHREIIADPANQVFVSAISAAEIEIKAALGKLPEAPESLAEAMAAEGFAELRFSVAHAAALRALPPIHRDPFDRMLMAQALTEGLPVLTADPVFGAYGVDTPRDDGRPSTRGA